MDLSLNPGASNVGYTASQLLRHITPTDANTSHDLAASSRHQVQQPVLLLLVQRLLEDLGCLACCNASLSSVLLRRKDDNRVSADNQLSWVRFVLPDQALVDLQCLGSGTHLSRYSLSRQLWRWDSLPTCPHMRSLEGLLQTLTE